MTFSILIILSFVVENYLNKLVYWFLVSGFILKTPNNSTFFPSVFSFLFDKKEKLVSWNMGTFNHLLWIAHIVK